MNDRETAALLADFNKRIRALEATNPQAAPAHGWSCHLGSDRVASPQKIPYDIVDRDTDNFVDNSDIAFGTNIRVPSGYSGYYALTAAFWFTLSGAVSNPRFTIRNAPGPIQYLETPADSFWRQGAASGVMYLAAGDDIHVWVDWNIGLFSDVHLIGSTFNRFTGCWLGR